MGQFFIFVLFCATSAAASSHRRPQHANVISDLSNKLGSDLHKKLSAASDNVFFSPLSISIALAMLFYGTRGRTADEMRRALGYQQAGLADYSVHSGFQSLMQTLTGDSASKEYLLYIANAMLTQKDYPILDQYKTGLQKMYKATARSVDFRNEKRKALQEINGWVKRQTNNKITGILNDVDPSTVMVLLNAVYFKGTWKTKFERAVDGTFFNKGLETERVRTPMMRYKKDVLYTRLGNAQAIELLYAGEDISMVIVLPDALDGLSKFEQQLTPNTLKDIKRSVRKTRAFVLVPKFKLEYKKTLNTVLKDLGLKSIFKQSADLSGISESRNLAVSEVVHKAVVEVNEEGTEAAAVTSIGVVFTSAIAPEIRFVVNRPFFFAIVDRRNDLVLFQGRVNKL